MSYSSLTPADWSLLEAYADDSLPPTERPAVEARLAADDAFRAALAAHHALVAGIRAEGRAALRRRLSRVESEFQATAEAANEPTKTSAAARAVPIMRVSWSARMTRLAMAAALVLATGLGWWTMRTGGAQAAADRFGVPEPGLPVLMGGGGSTTNPLINQAMNAYKLGNAADALRAWSQLPAGAIGKDTALYFRGIFQLKLHQNADAEAAMAHLRQLPTTAFRERADYYYAIALWAQDRPEEARAAFERLAQQPGHPFSVDARTALGQLK